MTQWNCFFTYKVSSKKVDSTLFSPNFLPLRAFCALIAFPLSLKAKNTRPTPGGSLPPGFGLGTSTPVNLPYFLSTSSLMSSSMSVYSSSSSRSLLWTCVQEFLRWEAKLWNNILLQAIRVENDPGQFMTCEYRKEDRRYYGIVYLLQALRILVCFL